jgi:hypothetical protein
MAYRAVHQKGSPQRVEGLASNGSIYPGHLVEMTSAAADTYQLRATQGGYGEKAVAVEDDLQGNDIATAYTANNRIQVNIYKSGEECIVRLQGATSITKGDKLMAGASGVVLKYVKDSSAVVTEPHPIGIALESLDLSDSSSSEANTENKIRMRWL